VYMAFLKTSKMNICRHELESKIKEGGLSSSSDVLNLLFGTYNDGYYSEYVVKKRWGDTLESGSFFNRVNTLWVYPLFLILIPFRYLMFGEFRINEDSRFGKVIIYLVGEMA